MSLKVNEIFTTFQGEGTNIGMLCTFLRLAICNLHCVWCDTAYTWNFGKGDGVEERFGHKTVKMADEVHDMRPSDVAKKLMELKTKNLVISGGEPMLQQDELEDVLHEMDECMQRPHVEIETNGTVPLKPGFGMYVSQINCSPKLENSGNPKALRYRPEVLKGYQATGKAWFKFVVSSDADLAEIEEIVSECGLTKVMLMALGKTETEQRTQQELVAQYAQARGWHFTPRLHVLIYGNKRGV